jgi:hypothetical protein
VCNYHEFKIQDMRALWWKQPYGQLMANGKEVETRTWSTDYRGPVLICTSKKPYTERGLMDIAGADNYKKIKEMFRGQGLYHGYAIAVGELYDCISFAEDSLERREATSKTFVKESLLPGLYGHYYCNVRLIHPFSMKGKLGWDTVSTSLIRQIIYL